MVKVYRVETLDGRHGLYSHPTIRSRCQDIYGHHPGPWRDPGLKKGWERLYDRHGEEVFFGFSSPRQMRAWVHTEKWRKDLDRDGYRLVTYEVPDHLAALGDKQAVFVRKEAKRLRARRVA